MEEWFAVDLLWVNGVSWITALVEWSHAEELLLIKFIAL